LTIDIDSAPVVYRFDKTHESEVKPDINKRKVKSVPLVSYS